MLLENITINNIYYMVVIIEKKPKIIEVLVKEKNSHQKTVLIETTYNDRRISKYIKVKDADTILTKLEMIKKYAKLTDKKPVEDNKKGKNCWKCKTLLNYNYASKCTICGYYICHICGHCQCNVKKYKGKRYLSN